MKNYLKSSKAEHQGKHECMAYYPWVLVGWIVNPNYEGNAHMRYMDPKLETLARKLWDTAKDREKNLIAAYIEDEFEYSEDKCAPVGKETMDLIKEYFSKKFDSEHVPKEIREFAQIVAKWKRALYTEFGDALRYCISYSNG